MLTRYLPVLIVLVLIEPVFGNENAVYDHEVETMWADIARGFSPLEAVEQSVDRMALLAKGRSLLDVTQHRLQLERGRLLQESLPGYFSSKEPTATSIVVWIIENSKRYPLDEHLINTSDSVFGYLLQTSNEPFFVARTLELEIGLLGSYYQFQKVPKQLIESAKTRYLESLVSIETDRSVLFRYLLEMSTSNEPDKAQTSRTRYRTLELAETILDITPEEALIGYADFLRKNTNQNSHEPEMLLRIRSHFHADENLRRRYQKLGGLWNRIRASFSSDDSLKCSALLGQLAMRACESESKRGCFPFRYGSLR